MYYQFGYLYEVIFHLFAYFTVKLPYSYIIKNMFFLFFFMYMCACVYVGACECRFLQRPAEGSRFTGAGVLGSY